MNIVTKGTFEHKFVNPNQDTFCQVELYLVSKNLGIMGKCWQ